MSSDDRGGGSGKPSDKDARKKILARRATFVAAALAGVSSACGSNEAAPHPCLNVVSSPKPTDSQPMPMVCLSPVPPPRPDPDASAPPPATTTSSSDPDATDAGPMPCLKVAQPRNAK